MKGQLRARIRDREAPTYLHRTFQNKNQNQTEQTRETLGLAKTTFEKIMAENVQN